MSRHSVSYFLREGSRGVLAHGFMSFASLSIITTCLVLTGTAVLLMLSLNLTIDSMGSVGDIRAYVDDNYSDEDAAALEDKLRALPNVSGVDYIDRARALEELKRQMGDNAEYLDGIEFDNPLRSSYQIWVKNLDDYAQTVKDVSAVRGVATVHASIETVNRLRDLRNVLGAASLGFIVMLGMVSIFIISNTIKLATFDRREEIAIMKVIGATDGFIRAPFIIESIILSLLAAALAFGLQWLVGGYITGSGLTSLSFINVARFTDYLPQYALSFFSTALLIGVLGSTLSIRRFLRV